ncbi:MAG: rubrerythrin family protein, partial [Promethearchaeota archaeon]
ALKVVTNKEVDVKEFVHVNEEILKEKVRDTKSNLIDAITGETYETKQMYKNFLKNSKKAGNEVAELSFQLAKKAEKVHANMFNDYLKKLEKNEPINKKKIYVCQICGNVEFGAPPSLCPICDHNQKFFEEI